MTKPLSKHQINKLQRIAFSVYKANPTNKGLIVTDKPTENITSLRAIAHDLRDPIAGIYSLVKLLIAKGDLHSENYKTLMLIEKSANSSLKLVNSLLSEYNVCEMNNKRYTDINEIVKLCVEVLQFKAMDKNQCIILKQLEHAGMLYLDEEKIVRVVNNLLSNAIKFTPPGGTIQINISVNDENIEVAIKDNGIGIPANIQRKLFDGISKTSRLGTSNERSYGLGLLISKKIVQEHLGRIWVESEPGKGSTFYIAFPIPNNMQMDLA